MTADRATSLLPALSGVYGDHPDSVVVAGESTSWEKLYDDAARLATRIADAPVVTVAATAELSTVTTIVAGLITGVPVVPMPPDAGPRELDHIKTDSAQLSRDGALILYTSGTTGLPKGIVVSAEAIAACLDGLADAWDWTSDDVLVHGLPLFHVHGLVLGVLGALRHGCRLVHTGRPTPDAYAAAGGTLYFGVPTVWSRLVESAEHAIALRSARLLVSGSAPLPAPVYDGLVELTGQRPVERYGMTETLITVAARADGPRRRGEVGVPISGVQTRVTGDDGELQVRGGTLADGLPLTDDGWFATGDAAEILPDGAHRIVGRCSTDLIKTGGFRVGAGEVEDTLLAHPAVNEAAVIGVPDRDLGQRIVAFVVADPVEAETLVDFVAAELSWHKRPREVRFVDALPRNALGKLQKQLLATD